MKKFIFFASTLCLLLVFACSDFKDLELPESVSVKTAAKFTLPMGNGIFSMREKAGTDKFKEVLDGNISDGSLSAPAVYEYSPNGSDESADNDVMQYVFDYPFKSIPLTVADTSLIPDPDTLGDLSTTIPVASFGSGFQDSVETGFNFSTLLGDIFEGDSQNLIQNIEFYGLDGYVFISKPTNNEELNKIEIKGKIWASYTDGSGNTVDLYLLDTDSADPELNESMKMVLTSPTLKEAASANEDGIITTDAVFSSGNYSKKIKDGLITELVNARPDDLVIKYNLEFYTESGSVTIDKNVAEILKNENLSISINLVLLIPFNIKFNDVSDGTADDKIVIDDLLAMFDSNDDDDDDEDEDVFKRDSAEDNEKWSKYTAAIKTIALNYTVANNLIMDSDGSSMKLGIYLYSVDESGSVSTWFCPASGNQKELSSETGNQVFDLKDEIQSIFSNYPFIPKFRIEIPADGSEKFISRNAAYGMKGNFCIEFDKDIPIEIWNKND